MDQTQAVGSVLEEGSGFSDEGLERIKAVEMADYRSYDRMAQRIEAVNLRKTVEEGL